jgi:signal transduction histidine kinase/ActR/RegA family two-component response regulator
MPFESSSSPLPFGNLQPGQQAQDQSLAVDYNQIIKNLQRENAELRHKLAEGNDFLAFSRTRDQFLAALSHELRDPLAPIRMSVALMNHAGSSDPMICQAREIIDRQVTHLTRLIDDLLDASRLAQGRIALSREDLDLGDVLHTAALQYGPLMDASGLHLEASFPAAPLQIRGDAARIHQMLSRLLENAVRFTDPGGRVSLTLEADGENHALIVVRDTGIGMAPETVARLFEPFTHGPADRPGGGLGLGLTLVQGLAALHGGSTSAQSDGPGRGSEFTIRLPLSSPLHPPRSEPVEVERTDHPLRILIVEDLSDTAITLELLLMMLGHTVETAAEGQAGLVKANRFRPDVILCDIGLPGRLDGYEVARAIRAAPALRNTHLIALTGFDSQEDKDNAQDAGFDLHLTKPVDPAVLERLLARLPDVRQA